MPLYEYQCDACGQRFEVIQKLSDPPPEVCRRCGKGPVHRLASSPAIQFKGSGWYITDYARGKSGASTPGEARADGEPKSGDKSDAGDKGSGATTSGADAGSSTSAGSSDPASGSSSSSTPSTPATGTTKS